MKVYFTAATSFNGELHETYEKIGLLLKQHRLILISGNQIIDKAILAKDKSLSSQQIFEREHKLIKESDLLIVEGSRPSLGVGTEITYALSIGKPVLILVSTKYEDKISPLVKGDPSENLFLRYYNDDNIKYKISDFISYVQASKKRKGKLIVIDGGDGSGKTTQAHLLVEHLKKKNILVKYVDFPQYYHSFHGKTIAKFLRGEFGSIDEVSPYLASLAYALDRATVKREMDDFLTKGGYIIANRYATSNMAHQGAKLKDEYEQKEFLKWIYELEYKVHKIPKENMVVYLYVPWKVGIGLSVSRIKQEYLKDKSDIAEKDINHRIEAEKMYLELAKKYKHWVKVDCVENEKLLSKEEIFRKVLKIVEPLLSEKK